jgi:hypothetical protein
MAQPLDELVDDTLQMDTIEPTEWTTFVDPSEPRYCVCNEVSYGDMVACDNADVSLRFISRISNSSWIIIFAILNIYVTVSHRMVPLWVCWYNCNSQRQMVLPTMFSVNETTRPSLI